MKDYWKDLKLSDAWSNRRRFNFLMDKIESAVVGDSDLLNSLNNIKDSFENIIIPSKTSDLENDSGFLTEHQNLDDYIAKSDTEGLVRNDGEIDTTEYISEHQDISGKIDRNELFRNGVFETKNTNNRGSTAMIWNESDGGGAMFKDNTSNIVSFVGVNEGSQGGDVYVQIYSKNKSTNDGVRLNFNPNGAFYTVGSSTSYGDDAEIVTMKDINELITRIEALEDKE